MDVIITDYKAIAERLARVLKSRPCNCQMTWQRGEMVVTVPCSRCLVLEDFEIMHDVAK